MEVHGRIAGSSNATLLVTCRLGGDELRAVYKPSRASDPCGTSRAVCSAVRWPPISCRSRSGGDSFPRRSSAPKDPSAKGRCSVTSPKTARRTTSPCATTRSGTPRSSACAPSTWSPTTRTARAGTCSWPKTGSGPSTTGSVSTRTTSSARSYGTSAGNRCPPTTRPRWSASGTRGRQLECANS